MATVNYVLTMSGRIKNWVCIFILSMMFEVVLLRLESKPHIGVKSALDVLLCTLQGLQVAELIPEDHGNLRFMVSFNYLFGFIINISI